jgi:hypothetical protein
MPFGCGEQNMTLFAPNVYVTEYLKQSGQLKAEIMATAEKLMITGYQRQLTYRRSDGSFSAFGCPASGFFSQNFQDMTALLAYFETVTHEQREQGPCQSITR